MVDDYAGPQFNALTVVFDPHDTGTILVAISPAKNATWVSGGAVASLASASFETRVPNLTCRAQVTYGTSFTSKWPADDFGRYTPRPEGA